MPEDSGRSDRDKILATLEIIIQYGGIDGGYHKQWVLDQAVRVLTNCPEVVATAIDRNGKEYTIITLGESDAYKQWVNDYMAGDDGPETHEWDTGTAP